MTAQAEGIGLVLAAAAVESAAQLLLKSAAGARRWLPLGVAAYLAEIALYTAALRRIDVSEAFPLGSLSFVGVALLSRLVLGESLGRTRWLGIGLIMGGAALASR